MLHFLNCCYISKSYLFTEILNQNLYIHALVSKISQMASTAAEVESHTLEVNPEASKYIENGDEFDPEVLKLLRLENPEKKDEPEKLDVYQRMEKKGVPTVEVIVS